MKEKKKARSTDGSGCGQSRPRVGGGFPGRMLVEQGGLAHPGQLLRGGQAPSPHIQQSVAKETTPAELRKPSSPATDSTFRFRRSAIRGCASLTEGPSVP